MTEIKKNLLQHNLKSFHIIYKHKHKLKSKNNNIKPVQCFCLNQHRSHGPFFFFSRMEMGEEPLVRTAAAVFQDLCYNYRDQLSAGIICAGWDKKKGGQVRKK